MATRSAVLKQEIAEREKQVARVRDELRAAEAQLEDVSAASAAFTQTLQQMHAQQAAIQGEIDRANSEPAEPDSARSSERAAMLRERATQTARRVHAMQDRLERLQAQRHRMQAVAATLRDDIAARNAAIADLKRACDAAAAADKVSDAAAAADKVSNAAPRPSPPPPAAAVRMQPGRRDDDRDRAELEHATRFLSEIREEKAQVTAMFQAREAEMTARYEARRRCHEQDAAAMVQKLQAVKQAVNAETAALEAHIGDMAKRLEAAKAEPSAGAASAARMRATADIIRAQLRDLRTRMTQVEQQLEEAVAAQRSGLPNDVAAEHADRMEALTKERETVLERLDQRIADVEQRIGEVRARLNRPRSPQRYETVADFVRGEAAVPAWRCPPPCCAC